MNIVGKWQSNGQHLVHGQEADGEDGGVAGHAVDQIHSDHPQVTTGLRIQFKLQFSFFAI